MKIIIIFLLCAICSFSHAGVENVNLADYVHDFTGKIDETQAVQTAEAEAFALKLPLFHPGGTVLTGYIKFRIPVIGIPAFRQTKSVFKSNVQDGSAAYETTVLAIENIQFLGNNSNPNNAIGLKAGQEFSYSVSRSYMSNVTIRGFNVGYASYGWINRLEGVLINYCNTGAIFDTANSTLVDIVLEQNKQDFIIYHSAGLHFTRLLAEGNVGNKPSTINRSSAIQIDSLYLEQRGRSVPWIQIGSEVLPKINMTVSHLNILTGTVMDCGAFCTPIELYKTEFINLDIIYRSNTVVI